MSSVYNYEISEQPRMDLVHSSVSDSTMSNKTLEYCDYDSSNLKLNVFFTDPLNGPDKTMLDGFVSDSYGLVGYQDQYIKQVNADAQVYVDSKYTQGDQEAFSLFWNDSIRKGLSNRIDYLDDYKNWVENIYDYVKIKEDSISDATSVDQVKNITWDFTGTFNPLDPEISIQGVLGISEISSSSLFEGYLERSDATTLTLKRYNGQYVVVNNEIIKIPSKGADLQISDKLIDSDGSNVGTSMSAQTLYYIYGSNSDSSYFSNSLRGSETSPSLVNGVKYLGVSGDPVNWRFVGWAYVNDNTAFQDNENGRLVVNQYNRKRLHGFINPGYTDDNTTTSATFTNTVYAPLANSTGKFQFISTGEDAVDTQINAVVSSPSGQRVAVGIGYDSTTSASVVSVSPPNANLECLATGRAFIPPEGYHYLSVVGKVTGGTGTIYMDFERSGSDHDPMGSYLSVTIMG
jgi:hypothetical protein